MADWYDSDWKYRIKITSDNTLVDASVKGLAIDLSNITDSDFWNNVQSDGADIRITESDGETELARDVISIDTSNEKGLIRFDSSGISTSDNTDFFIYFGNSEASEPSSDGTYGQYNAYDSDLKAYYPFENGSVEDRTENENDGTNEGASLEVSGKLGEAAEFDGSDDYVETSLKWDKDDFTYMAWAYPTNIDEEFLDIIDCFEDTSSEWARIGIKEGDYYFEIDNNDSKKNAVGPSASTNEWTHIVGTRSGSEMKIYVNGDLKEEVTHPETDTIEGLGPEVIGSQSAGDKEYFEGKIDEPSIKSSVTSSNEVKTIYNNESDNSSFWSISSVEQLPIKFNIDSETLTYNTQEVIFAIIFNIDSETLTYNTQEVLLDLTRVFNLETQTLTYNAQDTTFNVHRFLDLDTQTLTYNTQEVIFAIPFNIDTATLTYNAQDVLLDLTRVFNLETQTLTYNTQDLEFFVDIDFNIGSQTITYNYQDATFNISRVFNLDTQTLNYNFPEVLLDTFINITTEPIRLNFNFQETFYFYGRIDIDTGTLSLQANPIYFFIVDLDKAENDLVLEDMEEIFRTFAMGMYLRVEEKQYDTYGRTYQINTETLYVPIIKTGETQFNREVGKEGITNYGTQTIYLKYDYKKEGDTYKPQEGNILIDELGSQWRIENLTAWRWNKNIIFYKGQVRSIHGVQR